MKTALVKKGLTALRHLALVIQVGNPVRKAPQLIPEPEEHERLYGPFNEESTMYVWQLKNTTCHSLYGGAIINQFNKLYARFTFFPWGRHLHPALSLPYLGKNVSALDKAIFLITPEAASNYYHWVTDLLPRLLILVNYQLQDLADRVIILHSPAKSYEDESLALAGIDTAHTIRLKAFDTVTVNDLIIADYSGLNKPFPIWKKNLLDTLLPQKRILEKAKIYLLRGNQSRRKLIGEERLITLLEKEGFIIIDPQQLTFRDQISVLQSAEVVVAIHGASLTNIVFCEPQTLIIELRSTHLPPEHYSAIADTYQLRFETVSLPPERVRQKKHLANKESLLLTDQGIEMLANKLHSNELKLSNNR